MTLSTPIAKKIFRNYKKAATANAKDVNSMFHVGVCYSVGYGVTKDEKEALEWCVKAAKSGSLEALFYLAENHEIREIPVPVDMAFAWYQDAATAGHLRAMCKVICCYFQGYGTEKDALKLGHWRHLYNIQTRAVPTSEASIHIDETLLH